MQCDELSTALVDLVDGRLDPALQREAERHLEACAGCRALVDDLRTIRAAAFTLDRREPPAEVWASLSRAIAQDPGAGGRPAGRSNWTVWMAAAAVLMLATVVGLWPLLRRTAAPAGSAAPAVAEAPSVESVAAEFEAAEQHYQKAIADLETIARQDTGELDPQVAAVLQKNLTVIDQAISESRTALQSQPASSNAQEGLFDALRTKVALLQQTVELINEMRQGNQAEAARKFQTLSQ
jgi:anti-sigma factor RsiW